jgi:methionyl aminopeptidase
MIYYKTEFEIEAIRESSLLVSKTLASLIEWLEPGVTGQLLDKKAEEFIRDHNAIPAFKGYNGFPSTLCISPNDQVVHGIPSDLAYKEGDIVSIDCGVKLNGYYGDSAYTFVIGDTTDEVKQLLKVTKESLYKGISAATVGKRIGDIGYEIQHYVESYGYGVVRELVGHGLGKNLHESPEVPNFGKRGKGTLIQAGLVIAIEPMINMGKKEIIQEKDGWTIRTSDKKPSAHFEHTIAVTQTETLILSDFKIIENALKQKHQVLI